MMPSLAPLYSAGNQRARTSLHSIAKSPKCGLKTTEYQTCLSLDPGLGLPSGVVGEALPTLCTCPRSAPQLARRGPWGVPTPRKPRSQPGRAAVLPGPLASSVTSEGLSPTYHRRWPPVVMATWLVRERDEMRSARCLAPDKRHPSVFK